MSTGERGLKMERILANLAEQTLEQQLSDLPRLGRKDLAEQWRILYGSDPPPRLSRLLMVQALAHRLQLKNLGGLNFSTRRLLARVAQDESGKLLVKAGSQDSPKPGTVLIREWHGARHQVTVAEEGVVFRGNHYRSLSEVARLITGTRWSGPLFFGLRSFTRVGANGSR